MNKDLDEADVYRLLEKIKKANCLGIYHSLNQKIIQYIINEWEQRPTENEILQLICQFYGMKDENLDKLFAAVTNDEYKMLAALTYGVLTA